jgi:hypothetical protein
MMHNDESFRRQPTDIHNRNNKYRIDLHLQQDVDYILYLIHVKFRYDHLNKKLMLVSKRN